MYAQKFFVYGTVFILPLLNICRKKDIGLKTTTKTIFFLKLVELSSYTKGHHQNYCEIRKQHDIIKFKN